VKVVVGSKDKFDRAPRPCLQSQSSLGSSVHPADLCARIHLAGFLTVTTDACRPFALTHRSLLRDPTVPSSRLTRPRLLPVCEFLSSITHIFIPPSVLPACSIRSPHIKVPTGRALPLPPHHVHMCTVLLKSIRQSRVTGVLDMTNFTTLSRITEALDEYTFRHCRLEISA
jgi:hypothetical protein